MEHKAPEHQYERLTDAEPRQKEELFNLMSESKAKIVECDQVSTQLENALSELQVQHDQAKDLITETFQSYKAILEKCKDNALDELEKLHSNRELEIMDSFHRYIYQIIVYIAITFIVIFVFLYVLVNKKFCCIPLYLLQR